MTSSYLTNLHKKPRTRREEKEYHKDPVWDPWGDISFHASVAACDTTLDNKIHRSVRHVPR
uniref:Uncharacterized protein n=1 Tax=Solanum tuberosum TaxID=4113 RepID=M1DQD3_SOLTU